MIIFVTDEKISEKLCEKKNRQIVAVSDELVLTDVKDGFEAKQFLPPASVLAPLINHGDTGGYKHRYFHYLTDPRVKHMLLLHVYSAIDTPVFFICSKSEKDLKYLKFLREYIIEFLSIPKKYCVKYKDYTKDIKMDKKTSERIMQMMSASLKKAEEAIDVYSIGDEDAD